MPIIEYKPVTPGRRGMSRLVTPGLAKAPKEKKLLQRLTRTGGRNFQGFTTSRFMGGGARKIYRVIDFKRDKDNIAATVEAIEYDPNRTCHIALLKYADGERRYIIAPAGLEVGKKIMSGEKVDPDAGCAMPLRSIPLGLEVHNIELTPGKGGQLVRAAGGAAVLNAREGHYAILVLPSGEMRKVHVSCRATIGRVGNADWSGINWGKAGRKRWMGMRPHNRGVSMNPVSHPMGGGEGRRKGGRASCGPTGVLSKGGKTRRPKKTSEKFILRHRKRGRFQP